jgi:hypothetical protein
MILGGGDMNIQSGEDERVVKMGQGGKPPALVRPMM